MSVAVARIPLKLLTVDDQDSVKIIRSLSTTSLMEFADDQKGCRFINVIIIAAVCEGERDGENGCARGGGDSGSGGANSGEDSGDGCSGRRYDEMLL